jgi:hypothetical protein
MHNTFTTNAPGIAAMHPTGPYSNMHFRNNIFHGNGVAPVNDDAGESASGNDFNGNLLWSTTSTVFKWKGTSYSSLSSLRAATGFETNGRTGNPLFVSVAGLNLSLLAGSPAIDGAIHIPGINDGYRGSAPDMGAFEFDAGLDLTPPAAIRDLD